ncbi:MAG: AmmeMemoRadiSam system protein B [Planctomycetota bacterium]
MTVRQPFRAGSFYEGSPDACRAEARNILAAAKLPDDLPPGLVGGIVPHAGWAYSGAVAATTLKALDTQHTPDTVVLFGADHFGGAIRAEVYDQGAWATPLGELAIDELLATTIIEADDLLASNCQAHAQEHSLEVQAPLIQMLWPQAKIVPILVAPSADSAAVGRAVGSALAGRGEDIVIVGSTDLTHHGGHFPAPGGRGKQGVDWTVANDRRIIDLMATMQADQIVLEAAQRGNACGAGAIAATIAACRQLGATAGACLWYTNSYDVMQQIYPGHGDDTTVGYASVVFA